MKKLTNYFNNKPPAFKYSMFLIMGYFITFFQGSKTPEITVKDMETAKTISYKQGKVDALSQTKNNYGDTLIKNREKTLPVILAAPHKIDSLERQLEITKAEMKAWKETALAKR